MAKKSTPSRAAAQASLEAYLKNAKELISRYGWMVQGVGADRETGEHPFFYTVGLTEKNLPELLVTVATDFHAMRQIMNAAAQIQVTRGEPFQHMELVNSVIEGFPVQFRRIGHGTTGERLTVAHRFYGDRVHAFHMVFPDKNGLFPGQAGHRMFDQMWMRLQYVPIIDVNQ